MRSLIAICVSMLLACTLCRGQTPSDGEPDFIVPARPTVSNPAEFQRPGVLQLEFGYSGNFRAGDTFRSQFDLPLALRFAVSRRTLLELDTDSPYSVRGPDGTVARGAGDTQIGVQEVLQHETKTAPGIAIAYYLKIPTAKADLGTGRYDHNFLVLVSKTIGKTTTDANVMYLLAGRTSDSGHASSGQFAFCLTQAIRKRYSVQGEISGSSRNDQQPGSMYGIGVLTYQVNRRLVFDTGIRTGLTAGTPRVGLVAGVTVGVADLYHKHH